MLNRGAVLPVSAGRVAHCCLGTRLRGVPTLLRLLSAENAALYLGDIDYITSGNKDRETLAARSVYV